MRKWRMKKITNLLTEQTFKFGTVAESIGQIIFCVSIARIPIKKGRVGVHIRPKWFWSPKIRTNLFFAGLTWRIHITTSNILRQRDFTNWKGIPSVFFSNIISHKIQQEKKGTTTTKDNQKTLGIPSARMNATSSLFTEASFHFHPSRFSRRDSYISSSTATTQLNKKVLSPSTKQESEFHLKQTIWFTNKIIWNDSFICFRLEEKKNCTTIQFRKTPKG